MGPLGCTAAVCFEPNPDLSGPAHGSDSLANGQLTTYLVDGVRVPRDSFQTWAQPILDRGSLQMIARQAQMSAAIFSHYSVRDRYGIDNAYSGANWNDAANAAFRAEHLTVTRNWIVNDSEEQGSMLQICMFLPLPRRRY